MTYTTLQQVRAAAKERGLRVVGHFTNGIIHYTVLNFRNGVCCGGYNARVGRIALIEWANQYLTYPVEHASHG